MEKRSHDDVLEEALFYVLLFVVVAALSFVATVLVLEIVG